VGESEGIGLLVDAPVAGDDAVEERDPLRPRVRATIRVEEGQGGGAAAGTGAAYGEQRATRGPGRRELGPILNDDHHWTREQVVAWLEGTPPPDAAAPRPGDAAPLGS